MMGIKRGRKPLGKKQMNIRLLPEYSSLLQDPSPVYWWMRRNNIKMPGAVKHGLAPAQNPSSTVTAMLHHTMKNIIEEDPEAFLEFAEDMERRFERPMVHAKWIRIAMNRG